METTRDKIQSDAVKAFFQAGKKATIVMGTGTGKSKVAIDIIGEILKTMVVGREDILLCTSGEPLRDENWAAEFIKFGYSTLYKNHIVSECYHTTYKWEGRHFKIGIMDEVDFAITPEYIKTITKNTFDYLICLTGFLPEDKEAILGLIAPVCYRYATQDAQAAGVLNKTEFIFVEYNLSNTRDIMVNKKNGGHFYQSENGYYKFWDDKFQGAIMMLSILRKKARTELLLNPDASTTSFDKEIEKAEFQFKFFSRKRKELLHKLASSREVAKNIVRWVRANKPDSKILVFSSLTEQIDQICKYTYHTKNKKDNLNIEKFNEGEFKAPGVVRGINRGMNLNGLDYLLVESYVGSETDFQQRHGRGTRLEVDDVMKFIIMKPFYHDYITVKTKDANGKEKEESVLARLATQAVHWASEMTSSFDLSNSRTIVLDDTYSLPQGVEL